MVYWVYNNDFKRYEPTENSETIKFCSRDLTMLITIYLIDGHIVTMPVSTKYYNLIDNTYCSNEEELYNGLIDEIIEKLDIKNYLDICKICFQDSTYIII